MKLKSIIVGISDRGTAEVVTNKLSETRIPLKEISTLSASRARSEVLHPDSLLKRTIRSFQKQIGGGAAELIRDIDSMGDLEKLLVIKTSNLESSQVQRVIDIVKKNDLRGAKYFGQFSVEHLDTRPGHREEMPVISE